MRSFEPVRTFAGELLADIAGAATYGFRSLSKVAQQKGPAALLSAGVCHDLIQLFQLIGLANLKGLKVNPDLGRLNTLENSHASAAKGRDLAHLTLSPHFRHASSQGLGRYA